MLWISKAAVTASYRAKILYANRLAPNWTIGVVTGLGWGPVTFEPRPEDGEYPLYQLPQGLSGRNHFHWYRGLAAVVRAFSPDILHIDEEHYSAVTAQSIRIARQQQIPHIIFQTWQNIYKRYPWPFSAIEQMVFASAEAALAGTEEIRDVLRQKGFTRPIAIIPLGTDTESFRPFPPEVRQAARREFGTEGTFAVGYIGRLVEAKGLPDLFDGLLPWLADEARNRLVIAGDGPWREKGRQRAAERGLAKQVRWLPWLPSDAVPRLMNALDLLVVPSRTTPGWKEQFGRVLTEAMATGLPVIGSSSGEIPRVLDTAGLIFPEGDANALRAGVASLAADPVRREELVRRGLERVHARYTQAAVARQLLAFYQTLGPTPSPQSDG
ncbi:MAG: glycosyltransferase family 4 protein [Thermaerobacter sp.]|nr:glycosyltransferase family 4 protein [Thermaerobacter sp.]